jgi:hypothetical protein
MLVLDSGVYPTLTLKAWAGRVFVVFLSVCLSELEQQTRGMVDAAAQPEIRAQRLEVELANSALQCICLFFAKSEEAPRLLSESQSGQIATSAQEFLRVYEALARLARGPLNRGRWKIIPKCHAAWQQIACVRL